MNNYRNLIVEAIFIDLGNTPLTPMIITGANKAEVEFKSNAAVEYYGFSIQAQMKGMRFIRVYHLSKMCILFLFEII